MASNQWQTGSQKKFYYIYLLSIATLITFNQAIIQWHINTQKSDARVMNITGRQRMLSQQIPKLMLLSEKDNAYISQLQSRNSEWNFIQESLQKGNDSLHIPAATNLDILLMFRQLKVYQDAVSKAVNGFSKDTANRSAYEAVCLDNEKKYLPLMEKIVSSIEQYSEQKVKGLMITEIILALLSLIALYVEFRLLFIPWIKEIAEDKNKITKKDEQLKEISRIQSHEVRKPVANIIALISLIEDDPRWAGDNKEVLEMLKLSALEMDMAVKKVVIQTSRENGITIAV